MTTTTRKATDPPAETEPAAAPEAARETVSISAQLEQAQRGLLTVINDAVSPDTGHGLDITLARQASEVYQSLFGDNR